MKYSVIKTEEQYESYCNILEEMVFAEDSEVYQDEIELLTLLIEDWEERQHPGKNMDPVELLHSLMDDHNLNQSELAEIAGIGKSYMSEILNKKKSMSKKVIRNIANHFAIRQEALNREVSKKPRSY